jgi:hypothetical protein
MRVDELELGDNAAEDQHLLEIEVRCRRVMCAGRGREAGKQGRKDHKAPPASTGTGDCL